jgi:hypothetical protein
LIRPRRVLPHAAARRSRGRAAASQHKVDEACATATAPDLNAFFIRRAQDGTPFATRMMLP